MTLKIKSLILPFISLITILFCLHSYANNPLQTSGHNENEFKHPASFIWLDKTGEGRLVYALFRKDFQLSTVPDKAEIHLFADSRYHLFVNGTFINFGPGRFYPANPEYDTYDISPFLKNGQNVVAVKVLSNGMNTYQVPLHIGGFIAWGSFKSTQDKNISFDTPGDWKCKHMKGYDRTAPKMTFATGAFEVFDARQAPLNWNQPGIDLTDWKNPVKIKNQDAWGKLKPRTIPHLTQEEMFPKHVMGMYHLENDEDIYSFRIKTPDKTRQNFQQGHRVFAYTYIYSPKKQDVKAGIFWGEAFLNGKGPIRAKPEDKSTNRENILLDLNEGWNFFFIKYGVVWAHWDFHLALPNEAGLSISPTKDKDSEYIFMTAGPFLEKEEERVHQLELPFKSPDDLPKRLSTGWVGQKRGETAGNPAWEMVWKDPGKSIPAEASKVFDITIASTDGTALVFDLGGKRLGRIFIEAEAPEGTVIDFGWAEDMKGKKPWILKRPGLYTGASCIMPGGTYRFETFKPFGLRYLQINIRNNTTPVKIKKTGVVSQIYPFKKIGSFECSDPMMNEIWELGWRTLLVCSEDSYTDTPFRERGLYAGDALPEYAITLATSGDSRLIKKSLILFQDMYIDLFNPGEDTPESNVGLLSDFPFITLLYFAWYVDRTNDLKFALDLYPSYKRMAEMMLEKRNDEGFIHGTRSFVEWTQIDKSAQLTTMHSLLARCFQDLARVANKIGLDGDAMKHAKTAESLAEFVRKNFWMTEKGAFTDGYRDSEPLDSFYPISSAYPSLFGITTQEQEFNLKSFYAETLKDIGDKDRQRMATPYGGFYILGALYRQGYVSTAEQFIRKYWSPMILKHNDTAWENFGDGSDGSGQGTLSHAWSGGPTYYLTTQVLGVELGFPIPADTRHVTIAPQSESITWASGKVPHPKGVIEVDWKIVGNNLFIHCNVPEDVSFDVKPRGRLAEYDLWVNGADVE
jgi:alpha-L-rhamnosidase